MIKIAFISKTEGYDVLFQGALEKIKQKYGDVLDLWVYQPPYSASEEEFLNFADQCNVVFTYLMGGKTAYPSFDQLAKILTDKNVPLIALPSFSEVDPALLAASTVKMEEIALVREYLLCGGKINCYHLLLWLCNQFAGQNYPCERPQPLPWTGIYHPDYPEGMSIEEYIAEKYDPQKPTVGILFFRHEWLQANLAHHDFLIQEIEKQGANALPVFLQGMKDAEMGIPGIEEVVEKYFYQQGQVMIDVMINTLKFSILLGRAKDDLDFLKKLNIPVIQAIFLREEIKEWEESIQGLTPMESCISVALPEFDGVIHSFPVAGKVFKENNTLLRSQTFVYQPIPERMKKLVRQALNWAQLGRKKNAEKKIAIIFHNYPPNNATIGTALGLDSPESVWALLARMQKEGYSLDNLPANGQELIEKLIEKVTNDRNFLSAEKAKQAVGQIDETTYCQWYSCFPEKNQKKIREDWGKAPGDVFNYENHLLIPGIINGNVFIGLQPPRGFGENPSKIYHDPYCSPPHHYFAYYRWLRDVFQADAVLHIGTHGNLEWLPGKGVGLSEECYPDLALNDLPNIYPYLITITCEGVQAKRRSFACLIEHLPPVMTTADSYEDLAEVEVLLEEYYQATATQPEKLSVLQNLIKEKIREKNLTSDLKIDLDEITDFKDFLEELHAYLNEIKDTQIKAGLHILGKVPQGKDLREFYVSLLRIANGEIPSLREALAEALGYNYEEILVKSGQLVPGQAHTYGQLLQVLQEKAREIVGKIMEEEYSEQSCQDVLLSLEQDGATKSRLANLQKALQYLCQTLRVNLEKTTQEIEFTLKALDGKYVEPGQSGAPTRGMADILPTGRNFYAVDPRTIPAFAAWEGGKALGDAVLKRYLEEEGKYPENIGIIMWSGNNMRTKGECLAQFLYLLGVKPVWEASSGRVKGLEIIPLEQLGRPRIDVTSRISGMLRDSLPQAIYLLDQAVEMVASLDEPEEMNYVRKHVLEEVNEYLAAGLDLEQAREQAGYRIFGCAPGTYGAGVDRALTAGNWQSVDDLAQIYLTWGGYAYGRKVYGKPCPEQFKKRLSQMEVTIKNEDNREANILDSDDFNAFHGGLIAAVRSFRGKEPKSFCGDSSDPQRIKVRSLEEEMKLLFRSQLLNPKWIESMKKHGYKGAGDLASMVKHCHDWDATSSVMDNWMYDDLAEKYALDKEMQNWMKKVNPWALYSITQKLLEAVQREMWEAKPERKKELQKLYLEMEGELEGKME